MFVNELLSLMTKLAHTVTQHVSPASASTSVSSSSLSPSMSSRERGLVVFVWGVQPPAWLPDFGNLYCVEFW